MNKFKLHQGVYESHNINKDNFKKLTHNKPPYKHIDSKGKSVPVAVCTSCDNPIQLVGIYKERKTGYTLKGKSLDTVPKSVSAR